MIGRVLIACAIVVVSSREARAQSAAPLPEVQLQVPHSAPPVRARSMILAELSALEAQRGEYSLALPIGLLIGGGVVAVNGLVAMAIVWFANNYLPCDSVEGNSCGLTDSARAFLIGGSIAAGVGVVLLVIGAVVLSDRTGPRRELGNRIKALRRELQWSVAGLPLSVEPVANGAALRLRF
jgi:hypothetical protein